jgi:hypothetical protein
MVICSASIILVPNRCKSIHQEDHDCENRKRKLGEAQAAVGLASFKFGIDHSAWVDVTARRVNIKSKNA